MTKLGRLVFSKKIETIEEVYTASIPIKEAKIVDILLQNKYKRPLEEILFDDIMCILSVQKQTKAGQRTRFKAVCAVGDRNGHIGVGIKVGKEVQIAIKGALVDAKLRMIPVRRGYWGSRIGDVHTIPNKVKGKCGSCTVRMVPAPRGTGCVAAQVAKKILQFAGVDDVYTTSSVRPELERTSAEPPTSALRRPTPCSHQICGQRLLQSHLHSLSILNS
jgi:small subunit ribosomal protein S2e